MKAKPLQNLKMKDHIILGAHDICAKTYDVIIIYYFALREKLSYPSFRRLYIYI